MKFADRSEAGRALAPLVASAVAAYPETEACGPPLVLGVDPGGIPVAVAVAAALGVAMTALPVARDDSGVTVELPLDVSDRLVVVVDDGVETGTAAQAIGRAVRAGGAAYSVLAVPVCPREAEAVLALRFDQVVAVVRPLVRRDLHWHYVDLA
ncbi:MAG TPA: phosphoribosyltransferase family protein [Pedococcus sp.]|jgi:predicted phosphoribosyltransferase|nr:phosphoribosyltransferase family protein [Pedococcus sp.]